MRYRAIVCNLEGFIAMTKYAYLDYDGVVVRYFDYPAEGAVDLTPPEYVVNWDDFEEALF